MMTQLLFILMSLATAWELSSLKMGNTHTATLGLSNLDVDDDMFGAGAGDLLEAEVYEDWVTTDSRRFLQASYGGSAWVPPDEGIDNTLVPEIKGGDSPTAAAAPTARPTARPTAKKPIAAAAPTAAAQPTPASQPTSQPEAVIKYPVGGQKDEGGCLTSGGYSWCAGKNKCLRIWEEDCEAPEFIGGAKDEGGCYAAAGFSYCAVKSKCLRLWEEPCEAEAVFIAGSGAFPAIPGAGPVIPLAGSGAAAVGSGSYFPAGPAGPVPGGKYGPGASDPSTGPPTGAAAPTAAAAPTGAAVPAVPKYPAVPTVPSFGAGSGSFPAIPSFGAGSGSFMPLVPSSNYDGFVDEGDEVIFGGSGVF